MYKFILIFLFLFTSNIYVYSQRTKKIPPDQPKLVVLIVVEQMRYDFLAKYWKKFSENGFKRLLTEGTTCTNARYNYLFNHSSCGHTTIASGASPSAHGIVADNWLNRVTNKMVNCVYDTEYQTIGGTGIVGKASPVRMLTSTFADEINIANAGKSKIIGISLRPEPAILSTGHCADACYWFNDSTGNWITSSYYQNQLPEWVNQFNAKKFPDLYQERSWTPLLPYTEYTESLEDNLNYEIGIDNNKVFPYDLKILFEKYKDYRFLRKTPYGINLTKDFALSAIVNEELGKDDITDFLCISFASTGYVSDLFGTTSLEIEDTYLRLDKELAHLLEFIDNTPGKENTLLLLTSDRGSANPNAYMKALRMPTGEFNSTSSIALLNTYLKAIYGTGNWISAYKDQQIYLNQNLIEDSKLKPEEVENTAARFMVQFSGVSHALTASALQSTTFNDATLRKIQLSYHPKFSGDVLFMLAPGWVAIEPDITQTEIVSHNSGYEYDTHVPLLWYGWKIPKKEINRSIDMTDIAPTISNLLKVPFPNAATGSLIYELTE